MELCFTGEGKVIRHSGKDGFLSIFHFSVQILKCEGDNLSSTLPVAAFSHVFVCVGTRGSLVQSASVVSSAVVQ